MADRIRRTEYYYTTVDDRPGEGARVLRIFKEARVNLLAFHGFPAGDGRAQLDFVPADAAAFRRAAAQAGIELTGPKPCFLVEGEDRVGACADLVSKLADAGVGLIAMDAVAAGGGRYGALFWVADGDVEKAARALGAA
jgi:hypothetical protein